MQKKNKKVDQADLLLQRYLPIAEALAKMFHPLLEVVIHDYRKPKNSIVAAFNSQITERKPGASITSLGKERLKEDGSVPDLLIGYANETPDGRPLKSSSIAIRDDQGNCIGAICFNMSTGVLTDFANLLSTFTAPLQNLKEVEKFSPGSPKETIRESIRQYIVDHGLQSHHLSSNDKVSIVKDLSSKGIFNQRGAVTIVAKELHLTRPSVYRYLKDL